jgi:hypothetical protein
LKTQAKLAHLLLALCALILFHSSLAHAADAVATVYEDFGHTIKRDAFARGATVYIGIIQAQNDTCYRIEWIDRSGSVVATHDLQGTQNLSGGNSDRFDSFFIPLGGPSGIWTSRLSAFSSGNFNCTGTPTVAGTIAFDVARAVIIGAGTTGADTSTTSGGGDNDVFQDQPNAVQGGGTAQKFEVWAGFGNFKRAFVRFDHIGSGISGTVTDAKLRLLVTNAPGSARTYNAHRITGAWAETSITWNTQPAVAVSATDSLNTGTGTPSDTLVRWTLTVDENGFVNNSFNNNGWRISDSAEDSAQVLRGSFGSTEANSSADKTQGPVLLVDYDDLTIICPDNVSPQCASQIPEAATTKAVFLAQGGTVAGGCGDPVTVSSSDAISSQTCANKYTITRTYTVTDACGFSRTCDQTITVNDTMAPVITVAGQAAIEATCYQTAAAAQSAIQSASSADDHCDGNVPTTVDNGTPVPNSCNVTFTVSANDACGNPSSKSVTVKVEGTAPVITCPVDKVLTCGDMTTTNVTGVATAADDCDSDPQITYTDLVFGACPTGMTITRTWTAMDACGNSVSCDQIITVNPAAAADSQGPSTTNPAATPNEAAEGTPVIITATVSATTGGNPIDAAYYSIDGGPPYLPMYAQDGAFNQVTEVVTVTNTFANAGVYTMCIYGVDNLGNIGSTNCDLLVVVYDPSAGFVTGGGWINSPAGAYTPKVLTDTDYVGKANFGFVSKYLKGAMKPTGETEFNFKLANLNFHSVSYDWLVVSGAMAQYKGVGTINNAGNYGLLLTAVDGQLTGGGGFDKFRIKIWDNSVVSTDPGYIVYDNQTGSADTATPSTTIGGGSIVIHTKSLAPPNSVKRSSRP